MHTLSCRTVFKQISASVKIAPLSNWYHFCKYRPFEHVSKCGFFRTPNMVPNTKYDTKYQIWYQIPNMIPNIKCGTKYQIWYQIPNFGTKEPEIVRKCQMCLNPLCDVNSPGFHWLFRSELLRHRSWTLYKHIHRDPKVSSAIYP